MNEVVLHTHIKSEFDAVPDLNDVFERLDKIGAKTIAITDHGSLAGLQDAYYYANKYGIKIIYGVEAYVEHPEFDANEKLSHLILMAANKNGKKIIDKIVSKGKTNSKGMNYISFSELENLCKGHEGDIIATSACISSEAGIYFKINDIYKKDIEKIKRKQESLIAPEHESILEKQKLLKEIDENIFSLREEKNRLMKISKKSFISKEKKLEKLKEAKSEEALEFEKALKAEKEESEKAKNLAEELIAKITSENRYRTQVNSDLKEMLQKAEKYAELENEILLYEKKKKSEKERYNLAKNSIEKFANLFGKENFYVELQYHGMEDEAYIYPNLAKIAKELNLKVVAANDAHIPVADEHNLRRRQIAKFLRYLKAEDISDIDREMYIKDNDELSAWLNKILPEDIVKEAVQNTYEIGKKCKYVPSNDESHYPVFDRNKDSKELLYAETEKGIEWRYPNNIGWTQEHQKRMEYELNIICSMGYADYHLIVKDFLEYARIIGVVPKEYIHEAPLDIEEAKKWVNDNGWAVGIGCGIGRGSGAGSLVCYLLGITSVDPLKYGLLFERFLNPERVSMPDIDSDFRIDVREKTIEYVQKKYGEHAVCGILTENREGVKGAIRDAARFYGKKILDDDKAFLNLGNKLRKNVPDILNITFNTPMDADGTTCLESLKSQFANDTDALEILNYAKDIEGILCSYGMHAAGIVISDNDDITDYIPLRWNNKKERFTTQCDMVQVEEQGLLKMDFLGLKNLNIITDTLILIQKNHGITIDITKVLDDKEKVQEVINNIYAKGLTKNVFQFESAGMRSNLKDLEPTCIEDIIAMNALYRPGPMDFIPKYIEGKKNPDNIKYNCPQLEPILAPTYGCIVYQEQVMQIVRDLAGYTLGRSDLVRRAMSKKKASVMEQERKNFVYGNKEEGVPGCIANGISESVANKIYDEMIDFAKYAFNKSHAAAYCITSFFTAWLKYYYPAEYLCSVLNYTEKTEDYAKVIEDARDFNVEVLPPDINLSDFEFSTCNGKILFGLSAIKGVKNSAEKIVAAREEKPFENFQDFLLRGHEKSSSTSNLIDAGCFDSLGYSRESLQSVAFGDAIKLVEEINKKQKFVDSANKVLDFIENYYSVDMLKEEIKKRGLSNFTVTSKNVPSKVSVEKRIRSAEEKIKVLKEELFDIDFMFIEQDLDVILEKEKTVLGVYLTGHPIDKYISSFEKRKQISDTQIGDNEISGIVSDLIIRKNKYGENWATFSLEDRSGFIRCVMFYKQFSSCENILKNGKAVKLKGNVVKDEFRSTEETEEIQMIASNANLLKKRSVCALLSTDSPFTFYDMLEEILKYRDEEGIELRVKYDVLGTIDKTTYLVSKGIKELPNVEFV